VWAFILDLLARLFGVALQPRNASATSEARNAGAAERELDIRQADDGAIDKAMAAREAVRRDLIARGIPPGGLPDDGFRRD